jgi:hypothetical protein
VPRTLISLLVLTYFSNASLANLYLLIVSLCPGGDSDLITTALNDIKERLSLGVATLVAARAGCQLNEIGVDRDSIDVTIRPVKGQPICIDAQLKGSSSLSRQDGHLLIDIPAKNYNDLRSPIVGNARVLIVLDLHADHDRWLRFNAETIIAERLAYWVDLYGLEETDNTTRKRVKIPLDQTFTPENLVYIMQRRLANIQANVGGVS